MKKKEEKGEPESLWRGMWVKFQTRKDLIVEYLPAKPLYLQQLNL